MYMYGFYFHLAQCTPRWNKVISSYYLRSNFNLYCSHNPGEYVKHSCTLLRLLKLRMFDNTVFIHTIKYNKLTLNCALIGV